jgi:TonB family protein
VPNENGLKALVVDFDNDTRGAVSKHLEALGMKVISALDGASGLETFRKERPDIVITEAMLPKLHGFELCTKINEEASNVPVIILTGTYRNPIFRLEALCTCGAAAYLEKPFDAGAFDKALRDVLNHSLSHRKSELREEKRANAPDAKKSGAEIPEEKKREIPEEKKLEEIHGQSESPAPPPEISPSSAAGPKNRNPRWRRSDLESLLDETLAEFGIKSDKNIGPLKRREKKPQEKSVKPETSSAEDASVPPVKSKMFNLGDLIAPLDSILAEPDLNETEQKQKLLHVLEDSLRQYGPQPKAEEPPAPKKAAPAGAATPEEPLKIQPFADPIDSPEEELAERRETHGRNKMILGIVIGGLVIGAGSLFLFIPRKVAVPIQETTRSVRASLPESLENTGPRAAVVAVLNTAPDQSFDKETPPVKEAPAAQKPGDDEALPSEATKPMAPNGLPQMTVQIPADKLTFVPKPDSNSGNRQGTDPPPKEEAKAVAAASTPQDGAVPAVKAGDEVPLDRVDVAPLILKSVEPSYPQIAQQKQIEGRVSATLLIAESGEVLQVQIVQAEPPNMGFDKAAEKALKKWLYKPAEKDGVPVRVRKSVSINFTIKK